MRKGQHVRRHKRTSKRGKTFRAGRSMTSSDISPAFKLSGYSSAYGYGSPYNLHKTNLSKKLGKKDYAFRRWLIEEKNIVPAYLFAFGTPSLVGGYRKEFNKSRRRR